MVDNEARGLMDRIAAAARQLRTDCGNTMFRGDREACSNAAFQADQFLSGIASRLLAAAEAGDADARRRLLESGSRILKALTGAGHEITSGARVDELIEEIIEDVEDKIGTWLPWVIAAVVAAAAAAIFVKVS